MRAFVLSAVACLGLLAQPVFAEDHDDAYRILKAHVPMAQAIQASERYFKARAFEAELDQEAGPIYWKIKLIDRNARLIKVYVDSQTGRLLGANTYGTLPSRSNNHVADEFLKDYPKDWSESFNQSLIEHFEQLDEFERKNREKDWSRQWREQSQKEGWHLP